MRNPASLAIALAAVALAPKLVPAQNAVPRFEPADCDYPVPGGIPLGIERRCGHVVVPESRARPDGRTYRLAVVIYRAREPDGSLPLLLLHGGPGGAGGTRASWSELRLLPFTRHRDVIAFDLRGVSGSEPSLCPRFTEEAAPAFQRPTLAEWEAGYRQAVRSCIALLDAQGVDRTAFGADVNAADAMDLRRVLGHEKWDVYGVSYGGIVVQELLRLDSPALNAAAIVSSPMQGDDYAAKAAASFQHNLERVFAGCAAQARCRAAFPTLEQDFYALHEEFSTRPVEVALAGGTPRTLLLNGERFLRELRREFGDANTLRRLPLLVHELRRGDRAAGLQRLLGGRSLNPWSAIGPVVWCNEYGARYRAAVAALMPGLRPPFRTIADDFRNHCDLWLPRPTRQADTASVASDVPTLVLHDEYDADDVPATQQRMTARLTRAYSFTFPGETHAEPPFGCHGSIVQQFFANPRRAPDASCLALMPTIQFRTSGFAPTLTIAVRARGGDTTLFAGTWEATLAGGPDWMVQLETDGRTVRGMIVDQMLPIIDGSIEDGALRFKVKSADGARLLTFTAILQGSELRLTRAGEVLLSLGPPVPGLLNAVTPLSLTARRVR